MIVIQERPRCWWLEPNRTAILTPLILLFFRRVFIPKHSSNIPEKLHLQSLPDHIMEYFFLYRGTPSSGCCYLTLQNTMVYFKHQQVQFIACTIPCLSWNCYSYCDARTWVDSLVSQKDVNFQLGLSTGLSLQS